MKSEKYAKIFCFTLNLKDPKKKRVIVNNRINATTTQLNAPIE